MASALIFVCFSCIIMGPKGCNACFEDEAFSDGGLGVSIIFGLGGAGVPFARPHSAGQIVGTDGSKTGIASFTGNLTAITQPSGSYFVMNRAADCSLNLVTGTSSLNGSAAATAATKNYELTLHQVAGLTTTPDLYPLGCGAGPGGISSHPGVLLARKANAPFVLAVVGGNTGGNAVFILTPTTDFTSASFKAISSLTNASAINGTDLNGDGNGDLIVVNGYAATSPSISVVLGNGDGTFQNPVSYNTGGGHSVAATVDDVNGDGKLDVIVAADDQTISVLLGNGDGTLRSAQNFVAPLPGSATPSSTPIVNLITADVNGDGKKDVLGSNGLVLLGRGDGTFTISSTPAFPYMTATSTEGPNLAAGDVNKDGKLDLVTNNGNTISVWLGKGDSTFSEGPTYSSLPNTGFITVTDLDGDGNLDLYSGLSNSGFFTGDDTTNAAAYALMGNGDGTFLGAPAAPAVYNGSNVGDVNGDGIPDMIVPTTGTVSGNTAVFTVDLGAAKGTFTPTSTITAPTTVTFTVSEFTSPQTESTANLPPASYAIGDVNGDGHADVVYVADYRGYAVLFVALGNGDGTFATAKAYGFPQIAPASGFDISTIIGDLHIGDFNHDGKADIEFNYNDTTGPTSLYREGIGVLPGIGNGTFGTPALTDTYNSAAAPTSAFLPTVVAVTDVNSDGLTDLAVTNETFAVVNGTGVTTSTVQILLGKADGTFTPQTAAIRTTNLGQVVVADLNKDGKPDIAALTETSSSQAQLAIALGKGDGTFATPTLASLQGGDAIRSSGLVAADFDADGNVDLALLDGNDYSGIFYGKGDGTFTSVPLTNNIVPKDLISIGAGGLSAAVDINKDGKPDILAGNTVLFNMYGTATTVTQYATITTLSPSVTSITSGAPLTLTATVMGASGSSGTPVGTVTFLDGSNPLGTAKLDNTGKAVFPTTALTTTGTHNLVASYGATSVFLSSTSSPVTVTVTAVAQLPTTTTLIASPYSATAGTSIQFTATVVSSSIPTGSVNFFEGANQLGTGAVDGTGKVTYSTATLAAGTHNITAVYVPTGNYSASTSAAVNVTITAAAAPDFSLSLGPNAATVNSNSAASTTLTLTPIGGYKSATALTCSNLPTYASCTLSPTSITPDGTNSTTALVTIGVVTTTSQVRITAVEYAALAGFGALSAIFCFRRRRVPALLLLFLTAAITCGLSSCGGSNTPSTVPVSHRVAAGTYTLSITGSGGSSSHTANFTLTVQ